MIRLEVKTQTTESKAVAWYDRSVWKSVCKNAHSELITDGQRCVSILAGKFRAQKLKALGYDPDQTYTDSLVVDSGTFGETNG
jgi:hypothetical protein